MHDALLADSALPRQRVCLRLPLLTYSIGHEILLWHARNPILIFSDRDWQAITWEKKKSWLRKAVLICHNDWRGNQKVEKWLRLWHWMIDRCDWALEMAEFRNYLMEHRLVMQTLSAAVPEDVQIFEIANQGDKLGLGRALGAPFTSQLLNYAIQRDLRTVLDISMGFKSLFRKPTIYDVPFGLAANLMLGELECEGRLHIENEREAEERKNWRSMNAEIEGQKAAFKRAWDMATTDQERWDLSRTNQNVLRFYPETIEWVMKKQMELRK